MTDCKEWEIAAFAWLFGCHTPEALAHAWARVLVAYPEASETTAEELLQHVKTTQWYAENKHRFRHHYHGYADGWSDDFYDSGGDWVEEYGTNVFSEYDNEDDGVYSASESDVATTTTSTISTSGDVFEKNLVLSTESDETVAPSYEYHHTRTTEDEVDTLNEPIAPPLTTPKPKKKRKPKKKK
jgi:hypothetical protein